MGTGNQTQVFCWSSKFFSFFVFYSNLQANIKQEDSSGFTQQLLVHDQSCFICKLTCHFKPLVLFYFLFTSVSFLSGIGAGSQALLLVRSVFCCWALSSPLGACKEISDTYFIHKYFRMCVRYSPCCFLEIISYSEDRGDFVS